MSGLATARQPSMQVEHAAEPPNAFAAQHPPAKQDCVQKEHTARAAVVQPCNSTRSAALALLLLMAQPRVRVG
jgi:hypothetical protein